MTGHHASVAPTSPRRPGGTALNICFHGIGTPRAEREPGEAGFWIAPDDFRRLLDQLMQWPDLALSFDDGNRSDVEVALPSLRERGLRASFFPLAGRLGHHDSLGAEDLRALADAGMEVGTHGMHHRPWLGLTPSQAAEEYVEARELLASALGAPVSRAALPLGRYDRNTLATLKKLGYAEVNTSDRRLARRGAWLQPRFSVRRGETPQSLTDRVRYAASPVGRLVLGAKGAVKRVI